MDKNLKLSKKLDQKYQNMLLSEYYKYEVNGVLKNFNNTHILDRNVTLDFQGYINPELLIDFSAKDDDQNLKSSNFNKKLIEIGKELFFNHDPKSQNLEKEILASLHYFGYNKDGKGYEKKNFYLGITKSQNKDGKARTAETWSKNICSFIIENNYLNEIIKKYKTSTIKNSIVLDIWKKFFVEMQFYSYIGPDSISDFLIILLYHEFKEFNIWIKKTYNLNLENENKYYEFFLLSKLIISPLNNHEYKIQAQIKNEVKENLKKELGIVDDTLINEEEFRKEFNEKWLKNINNYFDYYQQVKTQFEEKFTANINSEIIHVFQKEIESLRNTIANNLKNSNLAIVDSNRNILKTQNYLDKIYKKIEKDKQENLKLKNMFVKPFKNNILIPSKNMFLIFSAINSKIIFYVELVEIKSKIELLENKFVNPTRDNSDEDIKKMLTLSTIENINSYEIKPYLIYFIEKSIFVKSKQDKITRDYKYIKNTTQLFSFVSF